MQTISLLLMLLIPVTAHSDDEQPSPIYTNVPGVGLVEVDFDISAFIWVLATGIPLFSLMMMIPFVLHSKWDLEKKKKMNEYSNKILNRHVYMQMPGCRNLKYDP